MILSLFHPGDLGLSGLIQLLAVLFLLFALPVAIVGFIIYKIANRRKDKYGTSITRKDTLE